MSKVRKDEVRENRIIMEIVVVPTKQCRFENTALFYFVNT